MVSKAGHVSWSTGYCDCSSDCRSCNIIHYHTLNAIFFLLFNYFHFWSCVGCLTLWCPCITFGKVAEILDKGTTCKLLLMNIIWSYYFYFGLNSEYIFLVILQLVVCKDYFTAYLVVLLILGHFIHAFIVQN